MDRNQGALGLRARRLRGGRLTVSLIAGCLAIGLVAGAAAAADPRVEPYAFTDAWTYDDCGFPIDVQFEISGVYRVNPQGHEFDNNEWRVVETNPETGESFVRSGNAMSLDTTSTFVEGTIYRFTTTQAGRSITFWDPEGNVLFRDRGQVTITYLLDTKGDPDPSNDEVVEGSVDVLRVAGPHPAADYFAENDWCEFVTGLIG